MSYAVAALVVLSVYFLGHRRGYAKARDITFEAVQHAVRKGGEVHRDSERELQAWRAALACVANEADRLAGGP